MNAPVLSFNAGEVTELLDGRSDFAKYSSACRTLQNEIPLVYGAAVRRPGTEFIYPARSVVAGSPVLLVPFEYAADASYVCEFGHTSGAGSGYIRFYKDGGILLAAADTTCVGTVTSSSKTVTFSSAADGVKAGYHATDPKLGAQITAGGQSGFVIMSWTNATVCTVDAAPSPAWSTTAITNVKLPVQVATSYSQAELFGLQFKQLNDVMWIMHTGNPTMLLSRTSATSFTLTYLQEGITPTHTIVGGPFRTRNDLDAADGVTLEASGTTGNVTLRAVGATELITAPMVTGGWTLGYDTGGWTIAGGTLTKTASTGTQTATAVSGMTTAPVTGSRYKVVIVCSAVSGTLTYTLGGTAGTTITAATITDYITATNTNKIIFSGAAGVTTTITSVSVKAMPAMFYTTHVGALFKLVQPRATVTTSGSYTTPTTGVICSALTIKGTGTFNTSGTWTGTVKLQRCEDGVNWEDFKVYTNRNASSEVFNEEADDVQYRANVTVLSSGTVNADLAIDESTEEGICIVLSVGEDGTAVAGVHVISDFASTSPTTRWAEGSWSDYRGWPKTLTFFQERAIFGGNTASPDNLWISKVGDYYDFTEGTNDDDAFTLQIASDKRQEIQWLACNNGVAIGTTGGVWRLAGSINNPVMTPTNYDLSEQFPGRECAALQPVPAGDSLLFIDRALRHVYELTWSDPQWRYVATPPITLLCEHLTEGGITDYAFQKNPEPVLWFTTNTSPYLFSITYNKAQDVIAGARHPIGGTGIVESVCRIPASSGEDEIWLAVRRTINSATVRYIERMKPWDFGAQEDAYFVDSGLKYDSTAATTFTGLDHLEGETVSILADGVVETATVVASGSVTIGTAASVVTMGLPYTYTIKPMKLDANPATRGIVKRISQLVLHFYETLGARYGRDNDHLYKVFTQILTNKYGLSDAAIFDSLRDVLIDRYGAVAGATQFDIDWPRTSVFEAIPLFTGDIAVPFDGAIDSDDDLIITGSDPLPCTLVSITAVLDGLGPQ